MDIQLFLFLNGLHADWLDPVMVAITEMWPWIPLYLLLLFLVFKQYGKRGWWILLGVCVVILCSDQLSAHVCKPLFQPRIGRAGTFAEWLAWRAVRLCFVARRQHLRCGFVFDRCIMETLPLDRLGVVWMGFFIELQQDLCGRALSWGYRGWSSIGNPHRIVRCFGATQTKFLYIK